MTNDGIRQRGATDPPALAARISPGFRSVPPHRGRPMSFVQSIDPLYVFSGFCVGALVGMTGVGGGSLMTPLLILLFGIHPAAAVGTDLLYAAATKTGG